MAESIRRLKKRKKASMKAKEGKPMGGAGQDYVTSGKGDLNRDDYVDIRTYTVGKLVVDQKKFSRDDWANKLYTDKPIDKKIGKSLADVNYMMYGDEIYKTTPKNPSDKSSRAKTDKLMV